MANDTAASEWSELDSKTSGLVKRVEEYAALTIPKVCLPDGFDHNNTDQTHDYQSIGAQAVNHVVNKLMLALFAPSRPFIKLQVGPKTMKDATAQGITEVDLNNILATGERDAVKELDAKAQRPKLYQALRHLVVAGNVLLYLPKAGMRVIALKYYRVRRDADGKPMEAMIREHLRFDELEQSVQDAVKVRHSHDDKVYHYRWLKRNANGNWRMTQWVDDVQLPSNFDGSWPAAKMPYHFLTWDLADESDYGTGLVEDYSGDLEALSVLSEAVVDGGVQGCEYRWLVNPTGVTSVDDVKQSRNGDVLAGNKEDLSAAQGGNPNAIEVALRISDSYERRVNRGFLMGSAVIRDAERVTQEEVRLTANELETAFGGVYSTLAASLQLPVAQWLFNSIGMPLANTDLKVTILTGLDAISRNGDLENLRLALNDLGSTATLPENVQQRLKWDQLASFIGQGRGVNLAQFLLTDAEFQKQQLEQQQSRVAEQVTTQAGISAAQQGPTQ